MDPNGSTLRYDLVQIGSETFVPFGSDGRHFQANLGAAKSSVLQVGSNVGRAIFETTLALCPTRHSPLARKDGRFFEWKEDLERLWSSMLNLPGHVPKKICPVPKLKFLGHEIS